MRSAVNGSFDQGHNGSLLSVRSYSNNEIEDIIAELEKLKAENKQLTSNKYTKSVSCNFKKLTVYHRGVS